MSTSSPMMHVAKATLQSSVRDSTFLLLTALFLAMVLLAAWLGWSATQTINAIYTEAVKFMQVQGVIIPPNPVTERSPLALLRNMSIYVALLGALASLVLGHLAVASDRKSGIIPIIASRPISRMDYASGKLIAIATAIIGLTAFAAFVNVVTLLVLPGLALAPDTWVRLFGFYVASAFYMMAFGFLAALCAIKLKSESITLLLPVTVWLVLTFILPQVTANISPYAAMNPLSATAALPTGGFFTFTDAVFGPLSLAEAYRSLSTDLLQLSPDNLPRRSMSSSIFTIALFNIILAAGFIYSTMRFDASRSDFNE